jgi:hypothetical protein
MELAFKVKINGLKSNVIQRLKEYTKTTRNFTIQNVLKEKIEELSKSMYTSIDEMTETEADELVKKYPSNKVSEKYKACEANMKDAEDKLMSMVKMAESAKLPEPSIEASIS